MPVAPNSYYIVHGWMRSRLNLKGAELQLYALIYGYTNTCGSCALSLSSMSDWIGYSRREIIYSLNALVSKGLIEKSISTDRISTNRYRTSPSAQIAPPWCTDCTAPSAQIAPPWCTDCTAPSAQIAPNNISNNISNNIRDKIPDNISSKDKVAAGDITSTSSSPASSLPPPAAAIVHAFEANIGTLSPAEYTLLKSWIGTYDPALIETAIAEASLSGKRSARYIDGILRSCARRGIRTAADFRREQEQYRSRQPTAPSSRESPQQKAEREAAERDAMYQRIYANMQKGNTS